MSIVGVSAQDMRVGGGTVVFAGNENGDLYLSGGEIRIDGTVGGNCPCE